MIETLKALSDENRLRITHLLMYYELCVCELEVILEMSQSNVSRHLGKLKTVEIITALKDAQWVHYKFNGEFGEKNKSLMAYLNENFRKDKIFQYDLLRCRIYEDSIYTCQNITNDKDVVSGYIGRLMKEKEESIAIIEK